MRRLAVLLVLVMTGCGSPPVEEAISEGYADKWPRISTETMAKWSSFPVTADPRPLVLLGEPVRTEKALPENGVDADGKVPAEAADAFAKLTKPGTANPTTNPTAKPTVKVASVEKGVATFATDRGPRELPAWIFRLTGVEEPVAVFAAKPDFQQRETIYGAKVSADGLTLTISMPAAPTPCGGEARITYLPEWLESPTAVAVGLKKQTGEVMAGTVGTCRRLERKPAEYTVKLGKPLENRVLVAADGDPLPVTSAQP